MLALIIGVSLGESWDCVVHTCVCLLRWPRGIMGFRRAFRNLQGKIFDYDCNVQLSTTIQLFVISASTTQSLFSTLNCGSNFQPRFSFSTLSCDSNFQPRSRFSTLSCDSNFQPRSRFSTLSCDSNFQPRFSFSTLKCDCNFQLRLQLSSAIQLFNAQLRFQLPSAGFIQRPIQIITTVYY